MLLIRLPLVVPFEIRAVISKHRQVPRRLEHERANPSAAVSNGNEVFTSCSDRGGLMKVVKILCPLLLASVMGTGSPQNAKTPFDPVPVDQRAALAKRLTAYVSAFRDKDWEGLYNLVSDSNKIGYNNQLKVNMYVFVAQMQENTYDRERLIKFEPVRTELVGSETFDVYGCGELHYGNQQVERIAAVRAVREHEDWFFINYDYPDPPEACSHLSNPEWKARNLRLDGPMRQLICELNRCVID